MIPHTLEDELEEISALDKASLDEDSTATEQAHSEEEPGKDTEDMSDEMTSPADDRGSAE